MTLEQLEKIAAFVGLPVSRSDDGQSLLGQDGRPWNPWESDADCLRLQVLAELGMKADRKRQEVMVWTAFGSSRDTIKTKWTDDASMMQAVRSAVCLCLIQLANLR